MAGNLARGNDLNIGQGKGLKILTIFGVIFLLLPLIVLIIYSFNEASTGIAWTGFSLKWYRIVFRDTALWLAVRNSLTIAVISTLATTILGTMCALLLAKFNFRGKQLFQNLLYVPVILPEIIFGVSLLALFMLIKFPLGLLSIICAHITFSFPFVSMIILAKTINFPSSLEEASLDLGAGRWQTFYQVILPYISPAVVSGALFAFTLSIDDFIVTFFTAGVGSSTLPLKIYSLIKFGITPAINAISTILIVFTILVLFLSNQLQKSTRIGKKTKIGIASFFIAMIILLMGSSFFTGKGEQLHIYNYSTYLDEDLIREFENQTGITVTLDYYNDNEELLSKMEMGVAGYDLIVPSGYMVEILKNEKLIAPIPIDSIPNYRFINRGFTRLNYDSTGRYYIPYSYGFTGIVYNSDYVKDSVVSWKTLWDPKYKGKILMVDDMKEVFYVAYQLLGYPMDTDTAKLLEARDLLIKQKPLLKKYESSANEMFMTNGDVWLSQAWNGQIARLAAADPKFKCCLPKEGLLFWTDNLCIPSKAPNPGNAAKFINFLLDPANSARNIKTITYAMPNDSARQLLEPDIRNNSIIFPDITDSSALKVYKDLGTFNQQINKAWTELKIK